MIKKMFAGPIVAGVVLLGTGAMAEAQDVQPTPVDAASDDDDDDDSSGKVGLLGLLGLAGLAGLAGLKRRDPVVRYDDRTTPQR